LIIEVDGSIHDEPDQAEYDAQRQTYLENKGLQVLRFTNAQVIQQTDAVLARIGEILIGD
jgi:leucyl-tRNA synthetase